MEAAKFYDFCTLLLGGLKVSMDAEDDVGAGELRIHEGSTDAATVLPLISGSTL